MQLGKEHPDVLINPLTIQVWAWEVAVIANDMITNRPTQSQDHQWFKDADLFGLPLLLQQRHQRMVTVRL